MNLDFLPKRFLNSLSKCDLSNIYDIRIRTGFPVKVNYENQIIYLTMSGISSYSNNAIKVSDDDIKEIMSSITENSIYAFNEQIKNGFITTKNGVRIGLAGKCVFDSNKILTIKDISSLNIRIPHEIKNCSEKIYNKLFQDDIYNVLVISPPERGKTTILKDLIRKINYDYKKSILVIDERGEFETIKGENIDIISYSNKNYAFNYGLRSLSPSVVFTDELMCIDDWKCVKNACNSGVKIIASCHADSIETVREKDYFIDKLFDYYVILKSQGEMGEIFKIYNKEYIEI